MIKLLDKETALKLRDAGFDFIIEHSAPQQEIYAFEDSDSLLIALHTQYGNIDYIIDSILRM
jgi:hypothetical protein